MSVHLKEGSGFVAVKTCSMIVFGSYSSSMYPSVCVEVVEKLGKTIIYSEFYVCIYPVTSYDPGEYLKEKGK